METDCSHVIYKYALTDYWEQFQALVLNRQHCNVALGHEWNHAPTNASINSYIVASPYYALQYSYACMNGFFSACFFFFNPLQVQLTADRMFW